MGNLGVDWQAYDFAVVVAPTRKLDGKFDALSAVLGSRVRSIPREKGTFEDVTPATSV
jgi:hypothetical protein